MVTAMQVDYIRAFDDNYIWVLRGSDPTHVALVDPGDAEPVEAFLEQKGWTPVAILITHHHGDHTGGIADLVSRFPVPVFGPRRESVHGVTDPVAGGDAIEVPGTGLRFRVIDTPGHTRGHVAYFGHDALFCGDTLFTAGCGRLFEGTPEQMYASLEKLRALPDTTRVFCAHEYTLANLKFARVVEPHSTDLSERERDTLQHRSEGRPTVPSELGLEKRTNPFLRCHIEKVANAAKQFAGRDLTSAAEVFAVVRYWKDTLD